MLGIHRNLTRSITAGAVLVFVALAMSRSWSQRLSRIDREQAQTMLEHVASDIREHYYDPKLHGIDFDAKIREAKERISQAPSYDVASADIAALFEVLDDSHSFYIPPGHFAKEEYGWHFEMIGDRCLVTEVKPRSDAEAKGVRPGDQLLSLQGFMPSRETLTKMEYVLNTLVQVPSLNVELLDTSHKARKIDIKAQIRSGKQITDSGDLTGGDQWMERLELERLEHSVRVRYKDLGPELLIIKLPEFVEPKFEVGEMIGKIRKHKAVILDLRGSPGGTEETLQYLLGGLFSSEIKIADKLNRTGMKPFTTKGDYRNSFSGKVVVLVDSESASASELFARTIQIQKRGTVLGDRTAGATMESELYFHKTGINPVFYYGASVTEANLILPDGKTLEHVGVTPDEIVLPTAEDLANGRDPVMSSGAALANVPLTPQEAGKLFPYEWPNI